MNSFLLEGGVAGHMNHLYDNPELTFKKIKDILISAASGKLYGTEKTDGQNIQLSYDVKTGTARAARNKGNIISGGLDAESLAEKFGGRGALEAAFTEAFAAFEEVVSKFSEEEKIDLFGPNVNIYYNAEIQDPRNANVINYDVPNLVIHRVGHKEYDRETGKPTNRDLTQNAIKLENILDRLQNKRESGKFLVQMNAIRNLEAVTDGSILSKTLNSLEKAISNEGISDNQTIAEYLVARIDKLLENYDFEPQIKTMVMKRILSSSSVSLNTIKKSTTPEIYMQVKDIVANASNLLKQAIAPIESIIHDFAVEMLRGLQSAFILDNKSEVGRLRNELDTAIAAIKDSNNDEAMDILSRQMEKLKTIENVSTAAEGFVFDYEGVTYKFTGNFAPMNQLLGLFKYGRGNIPPLKRLNEEEIEIIDDELVEIIDDELEQPDIKRTIALVPGAFKPPHKGHLNMVKHYADMADKVVIMISPLSRKTPSGDEIGYEVSKAIWKIYLKNAGLINKVDIIRSPVNSPVSATYAFVENKDNDPSMAQPGDRIIPGCSTKGGDEGRFKADFNKYAREGVVISDPLSCAFIADNENALSARDFRAALDKAKNDKNAKNELMNFIPDETNPNEILSILGSLNESSSVSNGAISGFSRKLEEKLINEVLNYLLSKGRKDIL